MLKVALINSVCGIGSTGKICVGIGKLLEAHGIDHKIFYTFGHSDYQQSFCYSNNKIIKLQALKSRVLGNYGFNSKGPTKLLISKLKEYQPDVVHIHNIHGHDCDLEMLFHYLKQENVKIVWTFHDCWAFTGYCTYFSLCGCNKWKKQCSQCPQKRKYSWFWDKSEQNYLRKKHVLSGLNLTIVTPSEWLASLVKQSFLKDYPVEVINNGIDLEVFKPSASGFRKQNNCEDKFILLGVSFEWEPRKGLDVFIQLAKRLSRQYQIVLVGTNEKVDNQLPENIISIHRTNSQQELAEIYSAADLLINPTREENFPTVNIESLACGTPVLTFDTGGSAEIIDESCGASVETGCVEQLIAKVYEMEKKKDCMVHKCVERAKRYDMNDRFNDYYVLYKKIVERE